MSKVSLSKRVRHWFLESWLLYAIVATFIYIMGILPRGLSRFIGRSGGFIAYLLDQGHRKLCYDNLKTAFPEKSPAEHTRILKNCYMHLGMCVADFAHFRNIRVEDLRGKWIVPEEGADEKAKRAVAAGRGVLAIGAHIGFWELSGFGYPALLGRPVVSVGRRIPAPRIDTLVNSIRTRLGNGVVQKEGALRHLLRALKENNGVGVIMDQHGGSEGAWVPFFGKEGSTIDTVARLHLKLGTPMLCNFMLRQSGGRYLWRCREVKVSLADGLTEEQKIHAILSACNREFEAAIRAAPEQWLWMHKRWRPKPQTQKTQAATVELSGAKS